MDIIELRKQIGQQIGLPDSFNGTAGAYAALEPALQIQVTNEMMRYIAAHPSEFTATQVALARRSVESGGIPPPDEYTLGEAFGDFTDEFLAQGNRIVTNAGNVVAGSFNRALIVAAVVAVLYFGAPYVLPKLKAAFSK